MGKSTSKNVGYRLFALLLALAPIAVLYFFPVTVMLYSEGGYATYQASMLDVLINMFEIFFKGGDWSPLYDAALEAGAISALPEELNLTLFGVLPLICSVNGRFATVTSLWIYAIPVTAVLTVLFALIALFFGKTAPALTRAIAYLNFWAYAGYAASIVTSCLYQSLAVPLDFACIGIAAGFLFALIILGFIKVGKKTWVALLLFLLTCAVAGAFVYVITAAGVMGLNYLFPEHPIILWTCVGLVALNALSLLISSGRLLTKKGYGFDLARYIFHLVLILVICAGVAIKYFNLLELSFLNFLTDAFSTEELMLVLIIMGAAGVVTILQIIIAAVAKGKKKVEKAVAPAPVEKVVAPAPAAAPAPAPAPKAIPAPAPAPKAAEVVKEEPVFVAPVEEVEEDEEDDYVEEIEYVEEDDEDDYVEEIEYVEEDEEDDVEYVEEDEEELEDETPDENKSKDPFIATLNKSERSQFTDLFILKTKGEFKNIPDYVVNGDNAVFFRKAFVYLGQIRDKVSSNLLDKMYAYYNKMK